MRNLNAAVNVFPDPPHRGAAWGLPRGLPGGLLFVQAPGVWGFSQVLSPDRITGFVYIENHSDYSSDCYKIKVLILQNIEAVMFKLSGGVDVRQSYMSKVMGGGAGASVMFKVMGGSAGASAMFKVMGGVSAMFKVMGVSAGASAMFKVMGGVSAMFNVIAGG